MPVASKSKIKSVCCGADHTMVLLNHDLIYVWGLNSEGQLGLGNNNNICVPQKLSLSHIIKFNILFNFFIF